MGTDQFQRVAAVFEKAIDLSGKPRSDYLAAICGDDAVLRAEVEELIGKHASPSPLLDGHALDAVTLSNAEADTEPPMPERVGPFRVMRELGKGGMGVVYLAEQDQPKRTVALKVIRPGLASPSAVRRFQHEANVLARLQHPAVAQIYQAGVADTGFGPQPYFAMEPVHGVPLTKYAGEKKLDLRARIGLLAAICHGVHHAHQKGVIHRDLKPANILVEDSGQAKILDFGIARVTDADVAATTQTDAKQLIGTIPYMSPEQVLGDPGELDIRSDVYSLGVIGFELLAGRLPYEVSGKNIPEACRVIRDEEPTRAGTISRPLRGDVETILFKALEKDKTRRYQSAAELAADLERFLRDQPITARPQSSVYQLKKFVVRNKGLAASLAVAGTFFLGAVIAFGWGYAQPGRANHEAQAFLAFYKSTFEPVTALAGLGKHTTVRNLLDAGSEVVSTLFAPFPTAEFEVRALLGMGYLNTGFYDAADEHFSAALELIKRIDPSHPNIPIVQRNIAKVRIDQGRFEEAAEILRPAFFHVNWKNAETLRENLTLANNWAVILAAQGRIADARQLLRKIIDSAEATFGPDDRISLVALYGLGLVTLSIGQSSDAEAYFREVVARGQTVLGGDDPTVVRAKGMLGTALLFSGRALDAEPILREVSDQFEAILGLDHPESAKFTGNFAAALIDLGHWDEAEVKLRRAIDVLQRYAPDHRDTDRLLNNLASLMQQSGRLEEAEAVFRQNLQTRSKRYPNSDRRVLMATQNLAYLLQCKGGFAEAESLNRKVLAACPAQDDSLRLNSLANLAAILLDTERFTEAESMCDEALQRRRQKLGEDHPHTFYSLRTSSLISLKKGNLDFAEQGFRGALNGRLSRLGAPHPDTLVSMNDLAWFLTGQDELEEAGALFDEMISKAKARFSAEHWQLAVMESCYGEFLVKSGRVSEAEPILLDAHARLIKALGESHPRTMESAVRVAALSNAVNEASKAGTR